MKTGCPGYTVLEQAWIAVDVLGGRSSRSRTWTWGPRALRPA